MHTETISVNEMWRRVFALALFLPASVTLATESMQIGTGVVAREVNVTIGLPRDADTTSPLVKLNGADVSRRFQSVGCETGVCVSAHLDATDGITDGKNVITALTKNIRSDVVSSRAHFEVTAVSASPELTPRAKLSAGPSASTGSVSTPFLPPTVTLKTLNDGGYDRLSSWIQFGQLQYPASVPSSCTSTSIYAVIVLDRRTLALKTTAPESSPQCFGSASALKTYFGTLPIGDLVIAGTVFFKNADKGLDTSLIGGQAWTGDVGSATLPAGYLAIGATGTPPQSAYQAYYVAGGITTTATPFATGMLQEDVNGNYNFQSTDMVEYFVVPNAPANQFHVGAATSVVTIEIPLSARTSNVRFSSYAPPITTDDQYQDGYWLLNIDRKTLGLKSGYGCDPTARTIGDTNYYVNCGRFYRTGTGTHASESTSEYQRLGTDLTALYQDPWTMVILVSVRRASCCNALTAVRGAGSGPSPYLNGFDYLANALVKFGATPYATVYPEGKDSTNYTPVYSLVTAAGWGDPLSGTSVESSSAFSQQAQSGLVHGTLARNLNGLYQPNQTSQETYATIIAKGGTDTEDFVLPKTANLAPVPWPVMGGALPGADSLAGQIDAYRFISAQLIRNSYLKGVSGPHQDDLHYFFNGSANTFVDYHSFDPINLPLPTLAPSAPTPGVLYCTSLMPGTAGDDICNANLGAGYGVVSFTRNDFTAARAQTSTEVIYLTNALQFLVTGSTNMKSVIAGGSSSVGLALTGAAATVLGSKLVPVVPETTVSVSWQNITALVGGVTSLAALVPGISEFAGAANTAGKIIGLTANAISGTANSIAAAGGIVSTTTGDTLPSSFSKFATTIGDLANGSMQGQLTSGFDVLVDDITSDWGRLSVIGPKVVDTNDSLFFSPNQTAQNVAVQALTEGASRSFYLALVPTVYSIHFWPRVHAYFRDDKGVTRAPTPDMGVLLTNSYPNSCYVFYLSHSTYTLQPYQGAWVYTSGNEFDRRDSHEFSPDYGGATWSLIAGPTSRAGQSDTVTQLIDPVLASRLFSSDALNLPILQFVNKGGPMQATWLDVSLTMPQRQSYQRICAGSDYGFYPKTVQTLDFVPEEIDPPSTGAITTAGLVDTVTTLQAPVSVLSGENLVLSATTLADGQPVKGGQISFRYDGNEVGLVNVDASGSASFAVTDPGVGAHSVFASYARVDPYLTSESAVATVEVSVPAEDMTVTASVNSLSLNRGSMSVPVTITATSQLGLTGTGQLRCTGLPVGLSCAFSPSQITLPANGIATTSLVIIATQNAGSVLLFLVLLPLALRSRRSRRLALIMTFVAGAVAISGCGGHGADSKPEIVTFVVQATVGGVTRSTTMTLTLE